MITVHRKVTLGEMGLRDLPFVGLSLALHVSESDRYPWFVALEPAPSPRLIGWVRQLMVSVRTPR